MQELAPVTSVDLPDSFEFSRAYAIGVNYRRPSSCHSYTGMDISMEGNVIEIGVVTSFRTSNPNCSTTGNLAAAATLNFVAEQEDFYIFKFWQGANSNGENRFLTVEVPVTRPGL